jgi:hypothetical protein
VYEMAKGSMVTARRCPSRIRTGMLSNPLNPATGPFSERRELQRVVAAFCRSSSERSTLAVEKPWLQRYTSSSGKRRAAV